MSGINVGVAMMALQRVYFQAGRRTGRTQAMVASLQDGDRVVFTSSKEARRVEHMCRDKGIGIIPIICDHPRNLDKRISMGGGGRPNSRTVFDHLWVEMFFETSLVESVNWLTDASIRHGVQPLSPPVGMWPDRFSISDILQHTKDRKNHDG